MSGNNRLRSFSAALAVLSGLYFGGAAQGAQAARLVKIVDSSSYNVGWWRTITADEKQGFIKGLVECQVMNLKRMPGFYERAEVQVAAMDKVASLTNETGWSMARAWLGATTTRDKASQKDIDNYWGPADESANWEGTSFEGQRGVVEGIIACRELNSPLRWSKPIDYYVDKIDRAVNPGHKYGPDPPNPQDVFATVELTKYADRPAKPSKPLR